MNRSYLKVAVTWLADNRKYSSYGLLMVLPFEERRLAVLYAGNGKLNQEQPFFFFLSLQFGTTSQTLAPSSLVYCRQNKLNNKVKAWANFGASKHTTPARVSASPTAQSKCKNNDRVEEKWETKMCSREKEKERERGEGREGGEGNTKFLFLSKTR